MPPASSAYVGVEYGVWRPTPACWIGHFSQGVGLRVTYTEIQGGNQTTHHPPDYFITGLEPS
jgi:hypothetical protein